MYRGHRISVVVFEQPEDYCDCRSHQATSSEPFRLVHPLNLDDIICEHNRLRNTGAHQCSENALMQEVRGEIHSRN